MLKLVLRRLLATVPTVLGVLLVVFLLVEVMAGDPAAIIAGEQATPEAIASIRRQLGLDRPMWERFFDYLGNVLQGDLGRSPGGDRVWDRIADSLPVTFSLGIVAMALAVVMGVSSGVAAALRRGRFLDHALSAVTSITLAVPAFVLGLALAIVFAIDRSVLPATGYRPLADGFGEWFRHLVLPGFSLAVASAAELARQTRGAFVDVLEQDYIRATRARGLGNRLVIGKHVAKNAATPVVTVTGLQVARILGGTIVIERIFGLNGFGSLAVGAVFTRDLVLVQGVVLISALAVLVTNLLVDLSYGYFSPRARA